VAVLRPRDTAIRLWDTATGKEVRRFVGQGRVVLSAAFSPSGKFLASAADDDLIRLWRVATGEEIRTFGRVHGTNCLAFSPDGKTLAGFASASEAVLWETANGREIGRFAMPQGSPLRALAFSPDGKTLALGGAGEWGFSLWDVAKGQLRRRWKGKCPWGNSIAFARDGKTLASGGFDGAVRLWETATGKEIRKFEGKGTVNAVRFSPNGKALAATGSAETILREMKTGKQLLRFEPPPFHNRRSAFAVAFTPDGRKVAWNVGQVIHLAEVATGKELFRRAGHTVPVEAVAFSPDGKTLAAAGGQLKLWDAVTGKERPQKAPGSWVNAIAYSPDGKVLVIGDYAQTIRVWDPARGKEVRRFTGEPGVVEFLAFLPGGKTVASMSRARRFDRPNMVMMRRERSVRLWDVGSGKEVGHIGDEMMDRAALSADGRVMAFGMNNLAVYDTASREERQRIMVRGHLASLALSPDGRKLAGSRLDRTLRLWEVNSGQEIRRFAGLKEFAYAIAISPDGRVLAAGEVDGGVCVWDLGSGKELRHFRGHGGHVLSLAFSADERRLASGSSDSTVLIWDTEKVLPAGKLKALRLAPDELRGLWLDLAREDAGQADKAIAQLVRAPDQVVPFLQERLRAPLAADPRRVARLLADLDDKRFAVRQKASAELARLGKLAEPALRKALQDKPSEEARKRLEAILKKLPGKDASSELWRWMRAVAVLEEIGSPKAQQVLQKLAKGPVETRVSAEAKTALERLDKRPGAKP
jgi:WD40 repeat protein